MSGDPNHTHNHTPFSASAAMNGALSSLASTRLSNGKDKGAAAAAAAAALRQADGATDPSAAALSADGTYYGHNREEISRLLIQALTDLGYADAASSVIRQSGYELDSPAVAQFRRAVLAGDWPAAEQLLLGSTYASSTSVSENAAAGGGPPPGQGRGRSGLVLVPGADVTLMRFWIRQQKYLECLEQGGTAEALVVLRSELTPLCQDTEQLHFLSSLLMCPTVEEVKLRADWSGAQGYARSQLLSLLSRFISPSVMLPEHRLATLLDQVKEYQVSGCVYHTSAASPSLYGDHVCDKRMFPAYVLGELESHSGEMWQVRFSHDGTRLASCGSGRYVVVWDVATLKMLLKLDGHTQGAGDLAWSPDDALLVSCGRDGRARLFDTRTGLLVRLFVQFEDPVSSCVWAPGGQSIVLGSFDKDRALCQWSLTGELLFTWTTKHRTEDLALSPDGQWLVAMDHEKRLHVYSYGTRALAYEMELDVRAVSVAISRDSEFLLVHRQDGELQLYNLGVRGHPVRKYVGATGGDCIIRSAFGGAHESFVVSGSEDGKLNIWHKNIGLHLFKLDAHKPRCNAACWSPTDACLLATCGDDNTIKLWANIDRVRQRELQAHAGGGTRSNGWRPELSDV